MSRKQKDADPSPKRGTRFVPAEDVPLPGLSPRAREVVSLGLCGFALYAMLCLATFRIADLDGAIPTGGMQNLGGAVGYYLAFGFTRSLGLAGWEPLLMLIVFALMMFVGRSCSRLTIKLLGIVCFSAMLAILFAGHDGLAGVRGATPFGAGCGAPAMAFTPLSTAITGQLTTGKVTNTPTSSCVIAGGTSNTNAPGLGALPFDLSIAGMTGCTLYQSAEVFGLPTVGTGVAGEAYFSLHIPSDPLLVGQHIYLQAFSIAPGANLLQVVSSNGIDFLISNQ